MNSNTQQHNMAAWNHLPNAQLIDQVLADMDTHHQQFCLAMQATCDVAQSEARRDARDVAREQARQADRTEAWDASGDRAWCAPWDSAWHTAMCAMRALIAYDDADQYLDMTSDQLRMWALLTESPAAVLLQPYVEARELISQLHSQEVTA